MQVYYEHGIVRRLAFPFFSLDQGVFACVALLAVWGGAMLVDVPASLFIAGGAAGMWPVAYFTAPAYFTIRKGALAELEEKLRFHKLEINEDGEWFPCIPRFLRWKTSKIVLDQITEHEFKVSGHMSMIWLLVDR